MSGVLSSCHARDGREIYVDDHFTGSDDLEVMRGVFYMAGISSCEWRSRQKWHALVGKYILAV